MLHSPHLSSRHNNSDPKFCCADEVGKRHWVGSHSFPLTTAMPVHWRTAVAPGGCPKLQLLSNIIVLPPALCWICPQKQDWISKELLGWGTLKPFSWFKAPVSHINPQSYLRRQSSCSHQAWVNQPHLLHCASEETAELSQSSLWPQAQVCSTTTEPVFISMLGICWKLLIDTWKKTLPSWLMPLLLPTVAFWSCWL